MRVVHMRKERFTHYIGRPSAFGNPFQINAYCDRDSAINQFEKYARKSSHLLALIQKLPKDSILGCFCYPQACHGDVIIKIWEEMHGKCV